MFFFFLLYYWFGLEIVWEICHARKCIANMRAFRGDNITIIIIIIVYIVLLYLRRYYIAVLADFVHSFLSLNRRLWLWCYVGLRVPIIYYRFLSRSSEYKIIYLHNKNNNIIPLKYRCFGLVNDIVRLPAI